MRLGLIIGHERTAPGATLITGQSEYRYNTEIARLAHDYAADKHPEIDVHIITRDDIGITGAYKEAIAWHCDAVIELHFNSFDGMASGTETLCSREDCDLAFAEIVQAKVVEVFKSANRGLKINPDRGLQSVTSFKGKANCLIEPFFGDHIEDAHKAIERKAAYAQALVESFIAYKGAV